MHLYRTHNCNELTKNKSGEKVKLSGWVNRVRDHGGLLFVDLRDHFGISQCVINSDHEEFSTVESLSNETVVTIVGEVVLRSEETINTKLNTGEIEIKIESVEVVTKAEILPFPVNQDSGYPEEMRLKYRFLDLRTEKMHNNIVMRSKIISSLRRQMTDMGFLEMQTPILTASSPEGARDFLVPSRLHPGKFYALPQAPQQFKQMLMVSGFDKYFQIAPCFRDEDARSDRSPGEFYQLDFEMAYSTQEDVFNVLEPLLYNVFTEFSDKKVSSYPFKRIPYLEAMDKYGSDKPDLRNPLIIKNATEVFRDSDFKIFAKLINDGFVVKCVKVSDTSEKPRSFFDNLNKWAIKEEGQAGLGYVQFKNNEAVGPIANNLGEDRVNILRDICDIKDGDAVFFVCGKEKDATSFASTVRDKLGRELELIDNDVFEFCWVVDFPMYEFDETNQKIDFSHNPFSMPQGGMDDLLNKNPLDILAYQYDIVCNGIELSSGAIRNHSPELMYKAFEIAGHDKSFVDDNFSGMINAFKFGAPPHGGSAPGVDRMVMLILDEENIREVTAFPLNQNGQDLLMNAPNYVPTENLEVVHIEVKEEEQEIQL